MRALQMQQTKESPQDSVDHLKGEPMLFVD